MEKCVIALDLGTTGNRSIAFDKKGKIISNFYYEFPQIFPAPAWVEQDPFDILNTALKSLQKTISFCKSKNYDILSIGITNQRETAILWNKKTGKPVYNAIVWQCRRTENICENLKNYSELIKEKTGLFLDPYFSATKIKWIIDNVAGVKESILKNEILFGTVDSWILWNLTEEKNHFTDTSNASRTLLYNINTLKYDNELLNIFKIPENILPEVKSSSSIFGFLNPKYLKENFTKRIPIIGILGDQQASLFAHASFDGGIVKNTYGTGLFVMAQSGKQPFKSDKLVSTIAWTIEDETYYAVEGSIFTGGALINWLKDGLKIIKSYSETDKSAKKLNSNEGVYFVPALSGLGAPYWNSSARGMIIGITGKTTKE
ncbi:MAG: FGGY family carbohydrate kinase, partial [bacterium]